MAAIRMSTAGIKMFYAVEETAGTRPTTGYKEIPEITEIPELSAAPETIDATPLSSTTYRIYVPGLIDLGGALSFTANFSQTELTLWNKTIVPAYQEAIKEDKAMWFCVVIPGFDDSLYFTGEPTKIGMPGASVGDVFRATLPITPSNEPDWYAAPTDLAAESLSGSPVGVAASKSKSGVVEV